MRTERVYHEVNGNPGVSTPGGRQSRIEQKGIQMSEKTELHIPEFHLEELLKGFDGYQNHLEWDDIPTVGREIL